ncbi:MAG: hypothetical protein NVSMB14_04390 [Isosphaeraceae bacterium]
MSGFISCYTNNYGPFGVRAAVENVREAGIAYLELALRAHDFGGLTIPASAVITEDSDDRTIEELREMLAVNDVKLSGCNIGGGEIGSVDGLDRLKKRLRLARVRFDVDLVVASAGRATSTEEWHVVVEHLRKLADLGNDLGLSIALETHKGPTQNAEAMLKTLEELDHPAFCLNFDTGNIAYYNQGADPAQELERVARWVRNVHLKDNRGAFEDWYFPALGAGGSVDFAKIRTIMDQAGYSDSYTIEIEGIGGEPEPGLPERKRRLAESVAHLESLGYS